MELQSLYFRVRKAQIALHWRPSHYSLTPRKYFLARDEALDYRNADPLVTALDLFFRITESKSVLLFGSMNSSKY